LNLKYGWLLPVAAAVLYALWSINQEPAPTLSTAPTEDNGPTDGGADGTAAHSRLEQRLALLERRLAVLEANPTGDTAAVAEMLADLADRIDYLERDDAGRKSTGESSVESPAGGRTAFTYPEGSETSSAAEAIRQAFDNDDMPEPGLQVELENAVYLFESPKVADLALREVDCRAHYCRLVYEDHSEDAAAAAITENELLLLLTEKYGNNITIHHSERNGSYRSLYIELPQ
jgi:hypothetical protein